MDSDGGQLKKDAGQSLVRLFKRRKEQLNASINNVEFSFLDFLRTMIHVAIDVPKNKFEGN